MGGGAMGPDLCSCSSVISSHHHATKMVGICQMIQISVAFSINFFVGMRYCTQLSVASVECQPTELVLIRCCYLTTYHLDIHHIGEVDNFTVIPWNNEPGCLHPLNSHTVFTFS